MAKRKKRQSLSPEALERAEAWWSQAAVAPEAALEALKEAAETDPDRAALWVEGLAQRPGPEAGWLAARAAEEVSSKTVRKAARRAIYLLKAKGVMVPAGQKDRPVFKPAEAPAAFGYMGGYYGDGTQFVFVALPRLGGEAVCGAAAVHFEKGIQDLGLSPMGRKRFEEMIAQTEAETPWSFARLETEDLIWLLKGAVAQSKLESADLTYLSDWLGRQRDDIKIAPIYARLGRSPDGEAEAGEVRRLVELLEQAPCVWWWPDLDKWAAVSERLAAEEESDLILSPAAEEERWQTKLNQAAAELFPPPIWPAWQRRLEETALFLAQSGREDDGRAFLSGALALKRGQETPLFKALVERAWLAEEEPAEAEPGSLIQPGKAGSLILPPDFKAGRQ